MGRSARRLAGYALAGVGTIVVWTRLSEKRVVRVAERLCFQHAVGDPFDIWD